VQYAASTAVLLTLPDKHSVCYIKYMFIRELVFHLENWGNEIFLYSMAL
jgi:hypothetical protein